MLSNAMGGGVPACPEKNHYEGVKFNVISVTRGGWGSNSLEKALRNIWMAPYV